MIRLGIPLLLWLTATVAAAAVPGAQALWDKGSYRQAFAAAIEPANAGDPQAQFLLGEAYRLGRSVDPDPLQARDWYLRAARQGDVASAAALGELLVHMRQSHDAVQWLTLAASHDNARATALLAAIYYTGDGAQPDLILATSLMKKAAALGSPEARAKLALMDDTAPPVDVSGPPVQQAKAELPQRTEAIDAPPARYPARELARRVVATIPKQAVRSAGAVGRIQVGAFKSAGNAHRAVLLLASRLHNPPADYVTVRSNGFYRVLLLIDDSNAAHDARARLTAIGWQHFRRGHSLRRA